MLNFTPKGAIRDIVRRRTYQASGNRPGVFVICKLECGHFERRLGSGMKNRRRLHCGACIRAK
jgi:hypothetical protein